MPSERQKLIKKIDALVSKIVRYGAMDENGSVECISCKKKIPVKKAHCCHRISRRHYQYRFDPINLAPGCANCNFYNPEFHLREFTIYQIDTLGREKVDDMRRLSAKTFKFTMQELREIHEQKKQQRKVITKSLESLAKKGEKTKNTDAK